MKTRIRGKVIQETSNLRFSVQFKEVLHVFDTMDVSVIVADGCYSRFKLHNGDSVTISKAIGKVEKVLPLEVFVRVHKSYMVNIHHILKYFHCKGELQMCNEMLIPVSIRRQAKIRLMLAGIAPILF